MQILLNNGYTLNTNAWFTNHINIWVCSLSIDFKISSNFGVTNCFWFLNKTFGGCFRSLIASGALASWFGVRCLDESWTENLNEGVFLVFTHLAIRWPILSNSFLLYFFNYLQINCIGLTSQACYGQYKNSNLYFHFLFIIFWINSNIKNKRILYQNLILSK